MGDETARVASLPELLALVKRLRAEFESGATTWENSDLASFLNAAEGWLEDSEGYYANRGERVDEVSPWRLVADMLMAARIYE